MESYAAPDVEGKVELPRLAFVRRGRADTHYLPTSSLPLLVRSDLLDRLGQTRRVDMGRWPGGSSGWIRDIYCTYNIRNIMSKLVHPQS